MTVFRKLSEALFGPNTSDTEYFGYVAQELAERKIDGGLWARALSETDYDERKARARYITLRVSHLKEQVRAAAKAKTDLDAFRAKLDASYGRRDYAACFNGWAHLAKQGDAAAMYSLAYLYAKGQGTDKDYYLAYYWVTRSGLAGTPNVQPLKNEIIPKMMSWDIKKAEEEAAKAQMNHLQLTGPK